MAAEAREAWLLSCTGLTVRRGRRPVLHDVSLSISPNESVALIGPNGSGKTTLLLALLGLLPPATGHLQLDQRDLADLSPRARGRFAAYVPQSLDSPPAFRVYDVVAGGRFSHVPSLTALRPADRAVITAALDRCGLAALADRSFDTLSGGERQKALLAAALAQEPRLLVLDEPSTALDPAYQIEVVQRLRDWPGGGRSLVFASHDLQLPAALGGRVVALRAGRVVADGTTAEVLQPDMLARVYGARFDVIHTATGERLVLPAWWPSRSDGR